MGAITELLQVFNDFLGAMPSVPPIAWENGDYKYVQGTLFLQAFHMPTSASPATLGPGGDIMRGGIFQINVNAPSGQGPMKAAAIVDAILSYFKPGTNLTSTHGVQVKIRKVVPTGGFNDNDWYVVPISIYYTAFTQNA